MVLRQAGEESLLVFINFSDSQLINSAYFIVKLRIVCMLFLEINNNNLQYFHYYLFLRLYAALLSFSFSKPMKLLWPGWRQAILN